MLIDQLHDFYYERYIVKIVLLILFLFYTQLTHATAPGKIKVAFLEFYTADGELISLEPGGRFGHVAISYRGGWLHSFPPRPVEWVPDLEPFGHVAKILEITHAPNYHDDFIRREIGKVSTIDSEWDDQDSTYCAKLIGKILGVPPRVNLWDAPIWREKPREVYTLWGLSPDDIYQHLTVNLVAGHVDYFERLECEHYLN